MDKCWITGATDYKDRSSDSGGEMFKRTLITLFSNWARNFLKAFITIIYVSTKSKKF